MYALVATKSAPISSASGLSQLVVASPAALPNPYLLPQKLTIADAAAASATLTGVLIVFGVAVVLVLPSIALLFILAQRDLVAESSSPSPPSSSGLDDALLPAG